MIGDLLTKTKMLKINWWKKLSGVVKISGSKNAALPIIWACLLLRGKIILNNMPKIKDVETFLDIISEIWAKYSWKENSLSLDTKNLKSNKLNYEKIKKVRASIFLLSPILLYFWNINIPFPGWCNIGKRPIDSHLNSLKSIGFDYKYVWENIEISWKLEEWDKIINSGFSVSATENSLIANVLRKWKTILKNVAIEPHVMNLVDLLRKAWADIKIRYSHEIIIKWVEKLSSDFEFDIVSDYIESGTFMVLWALASEKYLDIKNARIWDLYSFIKKLEESGVKTENLWWDTLRVYRCENIKAVDIQTNIFPGFPTDLQSSFAILQTQANGMSKVHEVLFEWRLNWFVELEKMWVKLALLNPHEAIIFWPNKLVPAVVNSWDLRAGMAMVIAWLITEWETSVTQIQYIYRWYEDFVEKLQNLWADIEDTSQPMTHIL